MFVCGALHGEEQGRAAGGVVCVHVGVPVEQQPGATFRVPREVPAVIGNGHHLAEAGSHQREDWALSVTDVGGSAAGQQGTHLGDVAVLRRSAKGFAGPHPLCAGAAKHRIAMIAIQEAAFDPKAIKDSSRRAWNPHEHGPLQRDEELTSVNSMTFRKLYERYVSQFWPRS